MNIKFTEKKYLCSSGLKRSRAGFTLLESLVAILVLTLSIVAPMSIASRTLFSSGSAREQVVAYYLAQEAIEGVRSIRDRNGLIDNKPTPVDWLGEFPCTDNVTFTIDLMNTHPASNGDQIPNMSNCSASLSPLNFDATKHYNYSSGQPTSFRRTVQIIESVDSKEALVTVTITWTYGSSLRSFVTQETIFDWQ